MGLHYEDCCSLAEHKAGPDRPMPVSIEVPIEGSLMDIEPSQSKPAFKHTREIITSMAVLDGEVAVPCYPQSATAGFNSLSEASPFQDVPQESGVDGQVRRNWKSLNPVRTGR